MRKFLEEIPYTVLIPAALLLGLAPFRPEPHLFEKIRLLTQGALTRPIDIFDLCMHGAPILLILAKLTLARKKEKGSGPSVHDRPDSL